MASKKTGNPVGRPTDYRPEYCQDLVAHMRKGGSFESFGAVVQKSKQTLYDWTKAFPEFLDAKNVGLSHSLKFYEDLGKMIAGGQVQRIKRQSVVKDKDGKPVVGPDGQVLFDTEYEPTTAGQSTWIFMMKNMHKWRDRADINIGGQEDAPPVSYADLSKDQIKQKMTEILNKAKERK
jgi:hypothetical protein